MAPSTDVLSSALQNKCCRRCKSNLVGGIKCNKCENCYHLSCAKLCNSVKFLNKDTIVCCDRDLSVDDDIAFFDAIENISPDKKVDINIVSYILKQKDVIIEELRDKVKLLYKQLELYENLKPIKTLESEHDKKQIIADNGIGRKKISIKSNESKQKKKLVTSNNDSEDNIEITQPAISTKQVATAILENETQAKCSKYINLAQIDDVPNRNDQWKKVATKRHKRQVIVGINNEIQINGVAVKGVPKIVTLHVYRVDPTMKANQLKDLIKPYFPEVTCEAISPKHPQLYSSFKAHIYENNFEEAMDPGKWPAGACVQRFFQLRRRTTSTV